MVCLLLSNSIITLFPGPREPKQIPQPILTYNQHMGGVDLFDQHRSYYPVGRPGKKWWRYLLWFLVDACLINAFQIYKKSTLPVPKAKASHDPLRFRLDVHKELSKQNVQRKTQVGGAFAGTAIADPADHQQIRMVGTKKNCVQCHKVGKKTQGGMAV